MDFELSDDLKSLQQRTREFVREESSPSSATRAAPATGRDESLRRELLARGRKTGLLAAHVSPEMGGIGLDHRGKAIVFEEAGYSLLGPIALNIFAPDEGNMHLLDVVATPRKRNAGCVPSRQVRFARASA